MDNLGDTPTLGAFDVLLDAPRGDQRTTVQVRCAGLDRGDAAQRARWQVARDRGVAVDRVHVIRSAPADGS